MTMAIRPAAFEAEGRWCRANLHSHTRTSDGDRDVADRANQYR